MLDATTTSIGVSLVGGGAVALTGWVGGALIDRRRKRIKTETEKDTRLDELYSAWVGDKPTEADPNPKPGAGTRLNALERQVAHLMAQVGQLLGWLKKKDDE